MSVHEEGSAFDQWYNGLVGFHINSERIIDDLNQFGSSAVDPLRVEKWMKVCWNVAIEEASNATGLYESQHVALQALKAKA